MPPPSTAAVSRRSAAPSATRRETTTRSIPSSSRRRAATSAGSPSTPSTAAASSAEQTSMSSEGATSSSRARQASGGASRVRRFRSYEVRTRPPVRRGARPRPRGRSASESAAVIPVTWKARAPASSAAQSSSPGSRSAKAEADAVVERPAGQRRLRDLDEVEPEPALVRGEHAGHVDPERAGVREDDLAERAARQARDPGDVLAEPREPDRHVQLGAGRPDFQRARLLEPQAAGRRQAEHRLPEGDDVGHQ